MATKKNYLYFGGERVNPITITTDFEFDESQVWNSTEVASAEPKRSIFSSRAPKKTAKRNDHAIDRGRAVAAASLPINVPDWSKILHGEYSNPRIGNGDDVNCDDEDERIPPHEYLARTRVASFSVQEGVGRTLKGRDMRRITESFRKKVKDAAGNTKEVEMLEKENIGLLERVRRN